MENTNPVLKICRFSRTWARGGGGCHIRSYPIFHGQVSGNTIFVAPVERHLAITLSVICPSVCHTFGLLITFLPAIMFVTQLTLFLTLLPLFLLPPTPNFVLTQWRKEEMEPKTYVWFMCINLKQNWQLQHMFNLLQGKCIKICNRKQKYFLYGLMTFKRVHWVFFKVKMNVVKDIRLMRERHASVRQVQFLCRLRSIAAHRDHFVRRLSLCRRDTY